MHLWDETVLGVEKRGRERKEKADEIRLFLRIKFPEFTVTTQLWTAQILEDKE